MKVKKFRIRPRFASVGRVLKSIMGVKQLPAGVEESLPLESETFLSHVTPAAFYHTWSQDEVPAAFKDTMKEAGLSKAIAVTAMTATIGSQVEEYLSTLLMNGETQRSQVVTALSEEAAELSFQFLLRLLADDAKSDDCDLSEPFMVTDAILLNDVLAALDAQQEGITLDSAQHMMPRFTRVALVAWWPVSKKKRSAAAAKKKIA